jgi:hypothetical protein
MRELFIYYRIDVTAAPVTLAAVQALQQDLARRHPGLSARLLRRPPEESPPSDTQTWMEIYSFPDAGGVSPELQAEIEARAAVLAPHMTGGRHIEVFVPCAS